MSETTTSGLERVFFGRLGRAAVDEWLASVTRDRLGADVAQIRFRAGRIDAVYALRLQDGEQVLLKLRRPPVDLVALGASIKALRYLTSAGYPCPRPIVGPVECDGRVVTIEPLLTQGVAEEANRPEIRHAMAASLAEHIEILRGVAALGPQLGVGPAWTRYQDGPWPEPHDPIFDFTTTPSRWGWLDDYARQASEELLGDRRRTEVLIGHGDWYAGNLRFEDDQVVAAFDWDLIVEPEPVIAGLSAGGFLAASAPTADEVGGFLADFDDARRGTFTAAQWRMATAAARWVLAFNARCDLSMLAGNADPGSALGRLSDDMDAYRRIAP